MFSHKNIISTLSGIAEKADYLSGLGIGAVLLNSIYASSNYDFGSDVTDFMAVDKSLGTMKDFEDMLEALHERGTLCEGKENKKTTGKTINNLFWVCQTSSRVCCPHMAFQSYR